MNISWSENLWTFMIKDGILNSFLNQDFVIIKIKIIVREMIIRVGMIKIWRWGDWLVGVTIRAPPQECLRHKTTSSSSSKCINHIVRQHHHTSHYLKKYPNKMVKMVATYRGQAQHSAGEWRQPRGPKALKPFINMISSSQTIYMISPAPPTTLL